MNMMRPKLYSVADREKGDPYYFGWCEAFWATSEEQALQCAAESYGGECPAGDDPGLWILSTYECDREPEQPLPYRERSESVLRDAGWMEESDTACDACGRYSMGYADWRVCEDCYLCSECRSEEADDYCEVCERRATTQ